MNVATCDIAGAFESFSAVARTHSASANAEPGQLVMYVRKSHVTKARNVQITFGDNKFVVSVPADLGRSLRTVFGADPPARETILGKCFLRARLATLSETAYMDLKLEHEFGPFAEHRERMTNDGSLSLAVSLKSGFGDAYETLIQAVEDDLRSANGGVTTLAPTARSSSEVRTPVLTLFPLTSSA